MSAGGDRELPAELTVEEFERRVREAQGDRERITRLINVLALSVIEEVRAHAEARTAADEAPDGRDEREP